MAAGDPVLLYYNGVQLGDFVQMVLAQWDRMTPPLMTRGLFKERALILEMGANIVTTETWIVTIQPLTSRDMYDVRTIVLGWRALADGEPHQLRATGGDGIDVITEQMVFVRASRLTSNDEPSKAAFGEYALEFVEKDEENE